VTKIHGALNAHLLMPPPQPTVKRRAARFLSIVSKSGVLRFYSCNKH